MSVNYYKDGVLKRISGADITIMTGATETSDGKAGAVPSPNIADRNSFLKGDGTWSKVSDEFVNKTTVIDENGNCVETYDDGTTITRTFSEDGKSGTVVKRDADGNVLATKTITYSDDGNTCTEVVS